MRNLIPAALASLLLIEALLGCGSAQEPYDLLIVGGRLVDGSGGPAVEEDLALWNDRIAARGALAGSPAKRVIDATGLVVAPGFIDMLGQSSLHLLVEPSAESKIRQGITTEITGEGRSPAPQNGRTRSSLAWFASQFAIEVDWNDFDGYFARLEEQGVGLNLASYVGATQVRKMVIGEVDRPPRAAELARMQRLVREAMEQGALGLSSALAYTPGRYALTDELVALASVAAEHDGIYATHLRSEGVGIFQALEESFSIARQAGLPLEIFHLKVAAPEMRGRMGEVVARIEAARASGIDVGADQYPYVAAQTSLTASIPPWAHAGGHQDLLERLRDPALRDRLREEIGAPGEDWENFYQMAGGAEGVLIGSVRRPSLASYEGMRLSELARTWGTHPIDALLDLLVADGGNTLAIFFLTSEDDLRLALAQPWVGMATDASILRIGGALARWRPHPRAFGSFPRILGHYVRDESVLSLEEAVRKMTSLAAEHVGLRERGQLAPGLYADIVIFDPEDVRDLASFEAPRKYSAGVEYVLVNGQLVLDQGSMTGALPGRVLRGPGWIPETERAERKQPRDLICHNEEIERSPDVLVIVPHPDDEILGFAGPIWSAATAPDRRVRVVVVTDGQAGCGTCQLWKHGRPPISGAGGTSCTPRELDVFGHVRRRETLAALKLLGVDSRDVTFLGYVDRSLANAWANPKGLPPMPPCSNDESLPEAWSDKTGANLMADLEQILREEPETMLILTTHPLDSHPDHGTLYEFVRAAAAQVSEDRELYLTVIHDNAGQPCRYPNPPAPSCDPPTLQELATSPDLLSVRRQERYQPESWWEPPVDVDYGTPVAYCLAPELYSGPKPLKRRAIEAHETQVGFRDRFGRELPPNYQGWADWRGFMLSFVHRNEVLFHDEGGAPTSR